MPKKCESCRFYLPNENKPDFRSGFCTQPVIEQAVGYNPFGKYLPHARIAFIIDARNFCDREGDGHFVYFEPKTPASGAAVSEPPASAGGKSDKALKAAA